MIGNTGLQLRRVKDGSYEFGVICTEGPAGVTVGKLAPVVRVASLEDGRPNLGEGITGVGPLICINPF